MTSTNPTTGRIRTVQCLSATRSRSRTVVAAGALAVGVIVLTAPAAAATPFSDACMITHGNRTYVIQETQTEYCVWQDDLTGNEWQKSNPLPPNPKNPPPTAQNPGLAPR
jgi:hypothetical protein